MSNLNDIPAVEVKSGELVRAEEANAGQLLTLAQAYTIDCPEMAEAAAEDLGGIKAKIKQLTETRMSMTRPLDESKKRIMELFAGPLKVLEQAEATLKGALITWNEAERKRIEAERRAAEEAARKEAERIRKEAEEQARIEREEAARLQAEAEAAAKEGNDEAALDLVAQAEAKQQEAEAVVIEAEHTGNAVQAMAPATVAAPAKLSGVSSRENWKAEVTDLMALIKAVAAGQASPDLLTANTTAINQRAKALKGEFKVPGIRVWPEQVISARAK